MVSTASDPSSASTKDSIRSTTSTTSTPAASRTPTLSSSDQGSNSSKAKAGTRSAAGNTSRGSATPAAAGQEVSWRALLDSTLEFFHANLLSLLQKNRRHYLLKDAVLVGGSSTSGSGGTGVAENKIQSVWRDVSWLRILLNVAAMVCGMAWFKQLLPVLVGFFWQGVSGFLPNEQWGLTVARLLFLGQVFATIYVVLQVKQKLNRKINDGELEQMITVETQQMTDKGYETFTENQSIAEYDLGQISTFQRHFLAGACVAMLVHWKWSMSTPLVIGSCFGVLRLRDWPMYRIHVLGQDATDVPGLKRPFKVPDPFGMQKWVQQHSAVAGAAGVETTNLAKKVSTKSLKAKEKSSKTADKKRGQ
eukprot:g19885.t1